MHRSFGFHYHSQPLLPYDFEDSRVHRHLVGKHIIPGSKSLPQYHRVVYWLEQLEHHEFSWIYLFLPCISLKKSEFPSPACSCRFFFKIIFTLIGWNRSTWAFMVDSADRKPFMPDLLPKLGDLSPLEKPGSTPARITCEYANPQRGMVQKAYNNRDYN